MVSAVTVGVLLILMFATLTRSTFGFGDAMFAMPLLSLLIGVQVATPLVAMISATTAAMILVKDWRHVDFAGTWRLSVASCVAIPLGVQFLVHFDPRLVKVLLAAVVLSFAIFRLMRPPLMVLKNDRLAFVFGFMAGLLGGAYNTQGPPVVIYGTLRRWTVETFPATLQGFFLPTAFVLLFFHSRNGLWTPQVLTFYALSLPVVLVSIWIGRQLNRSIKPGRFDRCIYMLLIVVGLILLGSSFGPSDRDELRESAQVQTAPGDGR